MVDWINNPLSWVGDRVTALTMHRAALDQVSQASCKKYSISTHNTQPRSYILWAGSCAVQSQPASAASSFADFRHPSGEDSSDEEDEASSTALIRLGMVPATYNALTTQQRRLARIGKHHMLIGQSTTVPSSIAHERYLSAQHLYLSSYPESAITPLADSMRTIGSLGERFEAKDSEFWTVVVMEWMEKNKQATHSMLLGARSTSTAICPRLVSSLSQPVVTSRNEITNVLHRVFRTTDWIGKKFDFWITRPSVEVICAPAPAAQQSGDISEGVYEIPCQTVISQFGMTHIEQQNGPAESALMSTLKIRLQDQSTTGALSNIIRGPTLRDGTTMLSLAKTQLDDAGTAMDVIPLVRLYAMALSLDNRLYEGDPAPTSYLPGVKWEMKSFKTKDRPISEAECNIIAMGLQTFTSWTAGYARDSRPQIGDYYFDLKDMDVSWTVVPVRAAFIGTAGILPYIMAHLHTYIWNGVTNARFEGVTEVNCNVKATVTTMPCAGTIYVPGVRHVILVIVDNNAGYDNSVIVGT